MKSHSWNCAATVLGIGIAVGSLRAADIGTAFTYQGTLENGSGPVTDTCDFRFGLWRDAVSVLPADQVGTLQSLSGVEVVAGVFTTTIDFGAGSIDGTARWLAIEVQCPGDAGFVLLAPRVELTAAPHALALPGFRTEPGGPDENNSTGPNIIGGYAGNSVSAGVVGTTVLGGGDYLGVFAPNVAFDDFTTVSGGVRNTGTGFVSTVGGGYFNNAIGFYSTVGGGVNNITIGYASTVGGGRDNDPSGEYSTVGGGLNNDPSGDFSTVGGGESNNTVGNHSTVGGGRQNVASGLNSTVSGGILSQATGTLSTIGGGTDHEALGDGSTVGGGYSNVTNGVASTIGGGASNIANGFAATVPGGVFNSAAGDYSFAAGNRGKVRSAAQVGGGDTDGDEGTFAWADRTNADFTSTGPNQFLIRATGGMRLATGNGSTPTFQSILPSTNTPTPLSLNPLGGNVGLGTATPVNRLDVEGGVAIGAAYSGTNTAPSNGLLVQGNVGIGLTSPETLLHVNGEATFELASGGGSGSLAISTPGGWPGVLALAENGNRRDIRFTDTGISLLTSASPSGPAAASGIIINEAGQVGIGTASHANRLDIEGSMAIGAGYSGTSVAPANGLLIEGNVGIGTTAPANKLDVEGGVAIGMTYSGSVLVPFNGLLVEGNVGLGTITPAGKLHVVGDIFYTGTITDISDERLKTNIAPVADALEKLQQLRGVYFKMAATPGVRDVGLIAQDVQSVLPEAVRVVDPDKGYLGVAYPSVIPLLVEAIKEQNAVIDDKNCRIGELEESNRELGLRLMRIEQLLSKAELKHTSDSK